MQGDPKAADRVSAEVMTASETASMLRRRLEAMDGELRASVASLRGCLEKLADSLVALEREVGSLRESERAASTGSAASEVAARRLDGGEGVQLLRAKDASGRTTDELRAQQAGSKGPADDEEGARLVALNMALNGDSREAIDRYLAEHFVLEQRSRLLDEVCSAAAEQ